MIVYFIDIYTHVTHTATHTQTQAASGGPAVF